MSDKSSPETDALIDKWRSQVYDIFTNGGEEEREFGEDLHFHSMAIGFFMGQGKTCFEANSIYQLCIERGCF